MPHYKNGNPVQVGDEIIVRCKVESIQAAEEYCNVNLRTVEPMPPYVEGSILVLNTHQIEKV